MLPPGGPYISSPQWQAILEWAAGETQTEKADLAETVEQLGPQEDPRAPYIECGWLRVDQVGVRAECLIRAPNAQTIIGPVDLPILWPIELPCYLEVTPIVAPPSQGMVTALVVQGVEPPVPVMRRTRQIAVGVTIALDSWVRTVTLHAAGSVGQWLDSTGALLAPFPGGSRQIRPVQAASVAVTLNPSLVTLEWSHG